MSTATLDERLDKAIEGLPVTPFTKASNHHKPKRIFRRLTGRQIIRRLKNETLHEGF